MPKYGIMRLKIGTITLLLCCILLCLDNCSFTEDYNIVMTESTLPDGDGAVYKFKKRYFLLVPEDTALLYGTRICTVITNGELTTEKKDSSYFRTITLEDTALMINNQPQSVSPQKYQMGTSLSALEASTILRYFKNTDSAILQLAYLKQGTMHTLNKKHHKVIPVSVEMGYFDTINSSNNKWPSFPLVPIPLNYSEDEKHIVGYTVAMNAIAIHPNSFFIVNGYRYRDGVQLKSFYSVYYEYSEGNKSVQVQKKIEIMQYYFKDIGLVEQRISTILQKLVSDGTTEIIKEHIIHQRGPEGAKIYPDWES